MAFLVGNVSIGVPMHEALYQSVDTVGHQFGQTDTHDLRVLGMLSLYTVRVITNMDPNTA